MLSNKVGKPRAIVLLTEHSSTIVWSLRKLRGFPLLDEPRWLWPALGDFQGHSGRPVGPQRLPRALWLPGHCRRQLLAQVGAELMKSCSASCCQVLLLNLLDTHTGSVQSRSYPCCAGLDKPPMPKVRAFCFFAFPLTVGAQITNSGIAPLHAVPGDAVSQQTLDRWRDSPSFA